MLCVVLQIHSDVAVKKEIGNLRVKCENYKAGCDWKGLFKQMKVCSNQICKSDFIFSFIMWHFYYIQ